MNSSLSNYKWNVNNKVGEDADLLLAKALNVIYDSNSAVTFTFKHIMHKLTVKLVHGNGLTDEDLKHCNVTLTATTDCTVNLEEGIFKATGTENHNINGTKSNDDISFILPPQTINNQTLHFTLSNGKKSDLPLSSLHINRGELQSGKNLIAKITVNKDGISFGSISISTWESQEEVTGTITMQ